MPRYMVSCHLFVDADELGDAQDIARAALARTPEPNIAGFAVGKAYEGFEEDDDGDEVDTIKADRWR